MIEIYFHGLHFPEMFRWQYHRFPICSQRRKLPNHGLIDNVFDFQGSSSLLRLDLESFLENAIHKRRK